jgi:GMP synthase (glutamine-hydrolysing)
MNKVLILDFGSQYTQLIARRIRELNVYCEIWACHEPLSKIIGFNPSAIILSGGPASVLSRGAPRVEPGLWQLRLPMLAVCYGMQLLTKDLGGKVVSSKHREYGAATIKLEGEHSLFRDVPAESAVWMSHGDSIQQIPSGYRILAKTTQGVIAAMASQSDPRVAVQFHPEVNHTEYGRQILSNFLHGNGVRLMKIATSSG